MPPASGPISLRLDLNFARPRRLVLGKLEVEHAVLETRLHIVWVDRVRQRQGAAEGAEAALLTVANPLRPIFLSHRPALALDGELIVARDMNLQVFQIHAWQLRFDKELFSLVPNIYRRISQAQLTAAVGSPAFKQAIHLILHLLELIPD